MFHERFFAKTGCVQPLNDSTPRREQRGIWSPERHACLPARAVLLILFLGLLLTETRGVLPSGWRRRGRVEALKHWVHFGVWLSTATNHKVTPRLEIDLAERSRHGGHFSAS